MEARTYDASTTSGSGRLYGPATLRCVEFSDSTGASTLAQAVGQKSCPKYTNITNQRVRP